MARKQEIELEHYMKRLHPSDKRTKVLIFKQTMEIDLNGATACGCGKEINALNSFRCVYCGQFMCVKCAEVHFGVTREEYDKTP